MSDFSHLLDNPEFEKFLREQGYLKKNQKTYKGKIVLADRIERNLNWTFATEAFLHTMMLTNGVERLEPMQNMMHFAMILYAMVVEDMVTNGAPNDKFINLDQFVELLPTDANNLYTLVEIMNDTFAKNNKDFMAI